MLRRFIKLYIIEDIKYDIGRKVVVDVVFCNFLEKVSRKGLGKKYLWFLY